MKFVALLVSMPLLLTACATGQKPVQVIQVCPRVPPLELDAPERDYLDQMRVFLSGSLPTQPGLKPPSSSAERSTPKLSAN